jgi:hypothetical protein
MRKIQRSGATGMRIKKGEKGQDTTMMFFHRKNISPETRADMKELGALLGLEPGIREIAINYGLLSGNNRELSFLTRSMLHIMIELATSIDVPPEHVEEGRTVPSLQASGGQDISKLIAIHHSKEKPADALTAVHYRDYWYWIDDRDFRSKRTFAFLMILFSLTETGGREGLPLVTIPAG